MELQKGTAGPWQKWFTRGVLLWLSLALAAVGVAWLLLRPHTLDTLRQLGLLYEVVGVLAVIYEIQKTRKGNKMPPLYLRLWKYALEVPFLRRSQTVILGSIASTEASGDTAAIFGSVTPAQPTTDERLALLEKRTASLETQQAALRQDLREDVDGISEGLKKEVANRVSAVEKVDAEVKEVATGGLDPALFGVWWLLIGMVMTTATEELCKLLPCCS